MSAFEPLASAGNVDSNGDLVDEVLMDRLRGAVRDDNCIDDLEDHLLRVARTVQQSRALRDGASADDGWIPGGFDA